MGIRGLLAIGLTGLLLAAGAIAGLVITWLLGGEAESQVVHQLDRRAEAVARHVEAACRDMTTCFPQISRALSPDPGPGGLSAAALLDEHLQPVAGHAEGAGREPHLGEVLHGARIATRRVHRPEAHPRGPGVDHRVALPTRLGDGRRVVLALAFSLDSLHASVRARQTGVLLLIVADLMAILLFGIYLSGRYVVRPLEALTAAADRAGVDAPVPLQSSPAEVARLSEAFAALVARLQAQNAALAETVAALSATRDELVRSEKLATVGRLAAGLAHEIGNPLAAVSGYVEYLQGGAVEPALQATLLGRMDRELQRIGGTLRDLLDFSRPSPAAPSTFDLRALAESARDLLAYQKDLRDLTVIIEGVAPRVRADRGRARQVLVNLLLNAADAMGGEGTVRVSLRASAGVATVTVSDDGPGVDPGEAPHLFEPFHTTKPAGQGTGLGLAICQRIVQEAGGAIRFLPRAQGAAVEFTLPHEEGGDAVGEAPDEVGAEEQPLERPEGQEGPKGQDQA